MSTHSVPTNKHKRGITVHNCCLSANNNLFDSMSTCRAQAPASQHHCGVILMYAARNICTQIQGLVELALIKAAGAAAAAEELAVKRRPSTSPNNTLYLYIFIQSHANKCLVLPVPSSSERCSSTKEGGAGAGIPFSSNFCFSVS